jgi:hypothetical protein
VSGGPLAQGDFADGDKLLLMGSINAAKIAHGSGWNFDSYAGSTASASTGGFRWFTVNGSGIFTQVATITNNGNVGIGTTTPSQALDVSGNLNLTGTIVQEPWNAPTLQNSWVQYPGYETVGYYKDRGGVVYIKGLVRNGTV